MASRYNNKRIVKSVQTIGQGRLLPGMIITFNYSEPGVMDPRPILLYLNTNKVTKNIEGLNINYLNPTKLKKLFTVADVKKTETDEVENLISLKESYYRLQIANPKKRSAMTPKRFYSDIISSDKYFKESYRSYKLTKLTSLKVTQINTQFITWLYQYFIVNYINENGSLESVPNGIHSVCKKEIEKGINEGVIYVLKNINSDINIDNTNQLHPFYLIYIQENGEILSNHLNVKNTLDILRVISKGKDKPIREVYEVFNRETEDGKKMENYSALLNSSIESILNVKNERDVDSLFSPGGTTALTNNIKGLEDFELLAFVVVK